MLQSLQSIYHDESGWLDSIVVADEIAGCLRARAIDLGARAVVRVLPARVLPGRRSTDTQTLDRTADACPSIRRQGRDADDDVSGQIAAVQPVLLAATSHSRLEASRGS